ncbi:hypothetical protein [Comamonas terrigena]|uniref:hypothetical protein n=1 Tax=Comamonas terrigena TaxID=32013 RepID=UPI00244BC16C|nr:hypothetical protein [Comamonas terrigena]MDH1499358.1 hypothetical protein [Comamonas terrigena]
MLRLPLLSAALAAVVFAQGCAQSVPRVAVQEVKVAVPVVCLEADPVRPQMPTDALPADAGVDAYVQAAGAEIERREGYEIQLVAALRNCKQAIFE